MSRLAIFLLIALVNIDFARRKSGWKPSLLSGLGALSNAAVIAANHLHMPADAATVYASRSVITGGYVLSSAQTRLPWLMDRFFMPSFPHVGIFSVGDVALWLGTAVVAAQLFVVLISLREKTQKEDVNETANVVE